MAATLRFRRRIYAATLLLYPVSLRRQFGEEMLEVFADQLQDAQQNDGWRGQARVWCCVGTETFCAVVSSHLQIVGISVAAGLSALGLMCTFFWAIH
jgi:hypothetical protein